MDLTKLRDAFEIITNDLIEEHLLQSLAMGRMRHGIYLVDPGEQLVRMMPEINVRHPILMDELRALYVNLDPRGRETKARLAELQEVGALELSIIAVVMVGRGVTWDDGNVAAEDQAIAWAKDPRREGERDAMKVLFYLRQSDVLVAIENGLLSRVSGIATRQRGGGKGRKQVVDLMPRLRAISERLKL